jgi:hypothetical protein
MGLRATIFSPFALGNKIFMAEGLANVATIKKKNIKKNMISLNECVCGSECILFLPLNLIG